MTLVPAPQDLVTGEPNRSAAATVHIEKYDGQGPGWAAPGRKSAGPINGKVRTRPAEK